MKRIFYIGVTILFLGLLGLLILDLPLRDGRPVTLVSPEGTPLSATYTPGSVPKGVLLLEGFGSDQYMLRSLVRDLAASGLHVSTFDYSGHGSSPGALEYDNASTDRLAGQVQTAMAEFQRLSGLDAGQIVWMGHSLGAGQSIGGCTRDITIGGRNLPPIFFSLETVAAAETPAAATTPLQR